MTEKKLLLRIIKVIYHLTENMDSGMMKWHIRDTQSELKVISALLGEEIED